MQRTYFIQISNNGRKCIVYFYAKQQQKKSYLRTISFLQDKKNAVSYCKLWMACNNQAYLRRCNIHTNKLPLTSYLKWVKRNNIKSKLAVTSLNVTIIAFYTIRYTKTNHIKLCVSVFFDAHFWMIKKRQQKQATAILTQATGTINCNALVNNPCLKL